MPFYRPFASIEEQNEWMSKSAAPEFEPYVEKVFTQNTFAGIKDDHGGFLVRQCGFVETKIYLESVRTWVEREGIFLEEALVEADLK